MSPCRGLGALPEPQPATMRQALAVCRASLVFAESVIPVGCTEAQQTEFKSTCFAPKPHATAGYVSFSQVTSTHNCSQLHCTVHEKESHSGVDVLVLVLVDPRLRHCHTGQLTWGDVVSTCRLRTFGTRAGEVNLVLRLPAKTLAHHLHG